MTKINRFKKGLLVGVLTFTFIFGVISTAQAPVPFKLTSISPRATWIGVLQGTWKEMGIQYGQRCAEDIKMNFDFVWDGGVLNGDELWQQGRTQEERAEYCLKYVQRSFKELSYLSPEIIDFFKGVAQGAQEELDKCTYAEACSHVLKVYILNGVTGHFHPNWDFTNDRPVAMKMGNPGKMYARVDGHDCNAFWVSSKATKTGETYATRAVQRYPFFRRQVAYVAIPEDSNARVFWGHGIAGNLGGLGGGLMNDHGVCVLTAGCSYSKENWDLVDETCAPGIRDFLLGSYGVIFSKSAKEAATKATVGTQEYRKLTGRKTVFRSRGANVIFADAKEAFCVEQNARHYAIRKPGYLGEEGKNYIVISNHFEVNEGSFNEDNQWVPGEPMTMYEPEGPLIGPRASEYYRFWSGMWMLRNNYGNIDREMVMGEFAAAHFAYDEAGNRYDPDSNGIPTVPGTGTDPYTDTGTFCDHIRPFNTTYPLGIGGNNETSVFNLSTLEVWWVPFWPCHYKEWNMSWDYLNLKPFSEYRKKLYGKDH
jgi:hypothetical protein